MKRTKFKNSKKTVVISQLIPRNEYQDQYISQNLIALLNREKKIEAKKGFRS